MGNFLEILQGFKENNLQCKKHHYIIFSQAYKSRRYACDGGYDSFFLFLSHDFRGVKCLSLDKSGVNK